MPRPLRIAYDGAIYHVTLHGNNNEPVFRDDLDYSAYLDQLGRTITRYAITLLAYGLMTNHLHLVVRTPRPNISGAMQWLHGCYAALFNRRHRRSGHLFRDRFYSAVIETDEYLLESTRYVHLNPVRAGLVQRPEDHRWSSYLRYIGGRDEQVPVETGLVLGLVSAHPQQRESMYRRFVEDGLTVQRTPPGPERVNSIATATAAALGAAGIPYAVLSRKTPRNRARAFILGVLRGVEGLSAADIAGYFGVSTQAVVTAGSRLAGRAGRDQEVAKRVAAVRAAVSAALRMPGEGGS